MKVKRTRKGYKVYDRKFGCPICKKETNLCIVNWLFNWARCSQCLYKIGYYTLVKYWDGVDKYKVIEEYRK